MKTPAPVRVVNGPGGCFTAEVQFDLPLFSRAVRTRQAAEPALGGAAPLLLVRNPRARRYILRLTREGAVRVTIPRRGSERGAREFAARYQAWIERQLARRAAQPTAPKAWTHGTPVLLRGEWVNITIDAERGQARAGRHSFPVANTAGDLRPQMEAHLRSLAEAELPARTWVLAAEHQCPIRRVHVRNQHSRWGSCSARGTISLNWRLIQAPGHVRDYLILHELMHVREMNHSPQFWNLVATACPDYATAERWLNDHVRLLDP